MLLSEFAIGERKFVMANGWEALKKQAAANKQNEEDEKLYQLALEKVRRDKEPKENDDSIIEVSEEFAKELDKQRKLANEEDIKMKRAFHVSLTKEDFEDKSLSPFTPTKKYNYQVNISHPAINPYYEKYKQFIGEAMILSDRQRLDFEKYVLNELHRLDIRREDYPVKTDKNANKNSYKKSSWSYGR